MKPLTHSGAVRARQSLGQATRLPLLGAAMLGTLFLSDVAAHAADTVTPIGFTGSYTQNFDTLPSTGTFTLTGKGPFNVPAPDVATPLTGFQFFQNGGTGANANFKVDDGTANSGSFYSYGTTGSSDRALGVLPTSALIGRLGAVFVNNSSTTYTSFNLAYTGEEWRYGGSAGNPNALVFNYAVTTTQPVDISATGTASSNLNFTSPVTSGTAGKLDGNAAPNRTAVAGTVNGLNWAPGSFLVINFDSTRTSSGSSNGLAIDDLTLTGSAAAQTTKPTGVGTATPASVNQGATTTLTVAVTPGTLPASTGLTVTGDLTGIGGSATQQFFDDGTNGDTAANDGTYSYSATVPVTTAPGSKILPVTVADAQARSNSANISLTVNQVFPASTTVVISEFRSRGAGGGSGAIAVTGDEFVELYNLSNAAVDISGYTIQYSSANGSTPSIKATIGANVTLPAGQHYLLATATGPLEGQANTTFTPAFIADNGGIGLFDAAGNRVDAVGLAQGTQLKEGTALASFPIDNDAANRSYERLPLTVNNQDTQNNVADFQLTTSNPQGLAAAANNVPVFNNTTYSAGLNDPFSVQLAATDADAGDTLTYTSTDLPAFLTVTSAGVLSGQPTSAGTFRFSVTVSDGRGGSATAKFALVVRDVPAGSDTTGPVVTRTAEVPSPTTVANLRAFTLAGTVQDMAPAGAPNAPVSGVQRVLVQLRTSDNAQSYNGSAFTTATNQGYFVATLQGGDGTATGVSNYSRSLSFVPSTLAAGDYNIVMVAQDKAGNFTLKVLPFTVVAAPAAAQSSAFSASKAPSTGSGGNS